ncbi:hypothetical protein GCM10015535_07940 [Streptomyces gelaticus]|uniref:Uncharacterized protein n=1 Tax=Streptomyces gelaticus TaxID=285446 RepID=A0ABQ2VTT1_9ACTN|nr:hypothetical protein GCM10015535_07940 [Streptomyces gelaticus]
MGGERGNVCGLPGELTPRDATRRGPRTHRPCRELGFSARLFTDMNVNARVFGADAGVLVRRTGRPPLSPGPGFPPWYRHEPAGERAQSGNACALPDVLLQEHEEER